MLLTMSSPVSVVAFAFGCDAVCLFVVCARRLAFALAVVLVGAEGLTEAPGVRQQLRGGGDLMETIERGIKPTLVTSAGKDDEQEELAEESA